MPTGCAISAVRNTSICAIRSLATNVRSDQAEEHAGIFPVGPRGLRPLRTGLIEVSDDPELGCRIFSFSRTIREKKLHFTNAKETPRRHPRGAEISDYAPPGVVPYGWERGAMPCRTDPPGPRPRACGYPQVFCPTPVERSARTCQGADKSLPSVPASG